ncbi:MAG: sugar ABC transporter permease [Anaerolineae bacterium]|nr:sugar ABC transporter permease [Anaerolineae bacterium]
MQAGLAPKERRFWPFRRLSLAQQEEIQGYLFLMPWLVGLVAFTVGPIIASLLLSFTSWNLVSAPRWVGLENYQYIFQDDPDFIQALKVTLRYAAISLPLHIIIGLALSLLLNIKVRGMNVYRTLFYLPSVLPGVATTLLWVWIFNTDFGIINWALKQVGFEGPRWFQNPRWALNALIIMGMWGVGGGAVIYLAGLQNIPPHLYEAAEIDGAGFWHRFWRITLPLLTPTLFFNLVTGLIGAFQAFVSAYIATNGGPMRSTLFYMLYLFQKAFQQQWMGYGSALAWILAIIILVCTVLVFKSSALWVHYEAERGAEVRKK